jgi:TonB family protein
VLQPVCGAERLIRFIRPTMSSFLRIGLIALTLATALPAQKSDEVYSAGNGVTSPRIVRQVTPEHPPQDFRISGTVLIGLIVNSKGEPEEVHVIRSLEKAVDQCAIDAVKQWRFEPGTKDGRPVAVRISVEIRFHDL